MKIRNGFVSNSSSSSFILKFDKVPETKEEMRVLLFGENPPIFTTHWDDDAISTEQVASIIFNDVSNSVSFKFDSLFDKIKEEIGHFSEYTYDEGYNFVQGTIYEEEFNLHYEKILAVENSSDKYNREVKMDWTKYYEQLTELSQPMFDLIEKVIKENFTEQEEFFEVEYSDNDGNILSYIEHSGVLEPIAVQRFSHH